MKKVFAVFALLCFLICLLPTGSARADSFPSEFFVNSEVYYSAEEMFMAYTDLNEVQREISAYILGMYNLMYLGSRGFEFQAGAYTNESSFIAKIKSFGYRFLQGAAEISFKSRMDNNFCKYASACILYASQCNVQDFDEWFDNLDENFVLPVDQGLLNSFTLLYNDNDSNSIASFGDVNNPWNSGQLLEYAFNDYAWENSTYQNNYNTWISSNSPVLYSNVYSNQQAVFGGFDEIPNTLFVLRGDDYYYFAWGVTYAPNNFRRLNSNDTYNYMNIRLQSNKVRVASSGSYPYGYQIRNTSSHINDLSDFIYECFDITPLCNSSWNFYPYFHGFYPFVQHVFLVDDLNNLTNAQEIYNNDSWDIIGIGGNMIVPIDTVGIQPKVITTINLPDNSHNPVNITDIIDDTNTVDQNGDPVNPWQITVIVQPNETNPISIDVNLFSSAKVYIEYLWNNATAFLQYCKNLLDCFAFTDVNGADYGPKYAIYGVIVLGVASGLIAKFLL